MRDSNPHSEELEPKSSASANSANYPIKMVPGKGVEPSRPFGQRILSPLCLPIPPPRHKTLNTINIFLDINIFNVFKS